MNELELAKDKVMMGAERKSMVMSLEEKLELLIMRLVMRLLVEN